MADKAVISRYTYRTEESQREDHAGFAVFVIPEDLPVLFRKTSRVEKDRLHVSSLAIIADNEKDFRLFLANAKERGSVIVSKEDAKTYSIDGNVDALVDRWRVARQNGASKIGAMRSGELKRKAADERACNMTQSEWYDLSNTNAQLEEKHGCRIGTLRRIAGDKGWCRNRVRGSILTEAGQKRKDRRNAKR